MDDQAKTLQRLADFVFECGMLKDTPRTGWPFLGSGRESVAEHSFRCAVIGYLLARKAKAKVHEVVSLCLFHDLHEARTGDFNYVYHRYNASDARRAVEDATQGTGLEDDLLALFTTFSQGDSLEAKLAQDADQLDLIANLVVWRERGNGFAVAWLESAMKRLVTEEGKALGEALVARDPNAWWYKQVPKSWWIHHSDLGGDEGA